MAKQQHVNDQLHRHASQQQCIAALSRLALESDDLSALFASALKLIIDELQVDYAQISEFLHRLKTFEYRASAGVLSNSLSAAELATALDPQLAFTLAVGEPVIVPDLPAERRFHLTPALRDSGVASSMSVVIRSHPLAYGVLAIYSRAPREFTPDVAMFLRAVTNVLAGAIQNDRAKRDLQDRSARMAAVIDTALEGIITIDEHGIIESVNPAACRLFGYQPAEVVGRNVNMLMPQPYQREHDGYMHNYLRTGIARIIGIGREVAGMRKDGSIFPLHLGVSEFRVDGKRMFTGQVRDMTERRRLEREILEIGAAEQRRIGQDLHDGLCQELTGVSFALEVLGRKLAARDAPETASIQKVAELIDQSISHARALAHGLQPVTLDAHGLESALQELAAKTEKLFRVSCLLVSEGSVMVHDNTVATHVYRIAQESIGNAIKHGKAKTIMLDLTARTGQLCLTITDDGIGLRNTAGDGKGIGMQTMTYRARVVGGTLEVRPGQRGGTVVVCTVPLRQLQSPLPDPKEESTHGGQPKTQRPDADPKHTAQSRATVNSREKQRQKTQNLPGRRPPNRSRKTRGTHRPGA